MIRMHLWTILLATLTWAGATGQSSGTQAPATGQDIDRRVRQFLDSRRGTWHDMNVPEADGQALFNIVVKHGYKAALEIGTSTGHSGIWIAWALSKTGGKLVTIEIDRGRHEQALSNFKQAGLSTFIDARLGDAHTLVPALNGPFDFVFCDADKEWYPNYLEAILPKLAMGGCFAAHNISEHAGGFSRAFLEYARSLPYLATSVQSSRGSGLSVSYRKADR